MRLDKYTPAAANEARSWIEGVLGARLPSSDLLDGLKDGVALCKYVHANATETFQVYSMTYLFSTGSSTWPLDHPV